MSLSSFLFSGEMVGLGEGHDLANMAPGLLMLVRLLFRRGDAGTLTKPHLFECGVEGCWHTIMDALMLASKPRKRTISIAFGGRWPWWSG